MPDPKSLDFSQGERGKYAGRILIVSPESPRARMNRLLQRFYAWLLPIGPMRLGWEQRDRTRYFLWELTLQGSFTLSDASGRLVTHGYLPLPPWPVPPVDQP